MEKTKRKYDVLVYLCWMILMNTSSLHAQYYLTDSIQYEDHSKFEDDLYWTNIYVNPINKDTVVRANTTQDFYIKNRKGVKIVEGRMEGYDGHPCGCMPEKNGIWTEKYETGALKSIETFECGYKKGQCIYYFENGNRQRVENYDAPYFKNDTIMRYRTRNTYLTGPFLEYFDSGAIKIIGEYEIRYESIVKNGMTLGCNFYSKKVGTWKTFDPHGKLIASEAFGY